MPVEITAVDIRASLVRALRTLADDIEGSAAIVEKSDQKRGARELYNGPILIGYEPDGTFQMAFALRNFYPRRTADEQPTS
mgnify:CR=1 FL=1